MLEIRFKGWDTKRKIMYSAGELGRDQLTLCPLKGIFINVSGTDTRFSEYYPHIIPLQFTGVKDIKGVDIYEGDIVKTGFPNIQKAKIEFRQTPTANEWKISTGRKYDPVLTDNSVYAGEIEVIGNIYENFDLMNK